MGKNKLPFSKRVVEASRYEAYIITLILLIFVWFDKDVSSIVVLASLSWSGYGTVRAFYIWLCKHEHLMDKKIEYKKLGLDSDALDCEIDSLETQEFNTEIY